MKYILVILALSAAIQAKVCTYCVGGVNKNPENTLIKPFTVDASGCNDLCSACHCDFSSWYTPAGDYDASCQCHNCSHDYICHDPGEGGAECSCMAA